MCINAKIIKKKAVLLGARASLRAERGSVQKRLVKSQVDFTGKFFDCSRNQHARMRALPAKNSLFLVLIRINYLPVK